MNRREAIIAGMVGITVAAAVAPTADAQALKRLLQGKARFVSGRLIHAGPEQIPEARGAVAKQLQEAEPILAETGAVPGNSKSSARAMAYFSARTETAR